MAQRRTLIPEIHQRAINADRLRSYHEQAITELQRQLLAFPLFVKDIALPNNTTVRVRHGLGRRYVAILLTPVRGPSTSGRLEEIRTGADYDPTQWVLLKATGYSTGTIYVDAVIV